MTGANHRVRRRGALPRIEAAANAIAAYTPRTTMAVPGVEDPGRAVHGHGRLEGGAGQVPTKAGRKKLAERDASDDDDAPSPWSPLRCVE